MAQNFLFQMEKLTFRDYDMNKKRLCALLVDGGSEALRYTISRIVLEVNLQNNLNQIRHQLCDNDKHLLYPTGSILPSLDGLTQYGLDIVWTKVLQQSPESSGIKKDMIYDYLVSYGLDIQLKTNKHKIQKLKNDKKLLSQWQWDILYPELNKTVDLEAFDITLLCFVIHNVFEFEPSSDARNQHPSAVEISIGDDIWRLRKQRDALAGISSGINDSTFQTFWNEIISVLCRLKPKQEFHDKIQHLHDCQVDLKHADNNEQLIAYWENHDRRFEILENDKSHMQRSQIETRRAFRMQRKEFSSSLQLTKLTGYKKRCLEISSLRKFEKTKKALGKQRTESQSSWLTSDFDKSLRISSKLWAQVHTKDFRRQRTAISPSLPFSYLTSDLERYFEKSSFNDYEKAVKGFKTEPRSGLQPSIFTRYKEISSLPRAVKEREVLQMCKGAIVNGNMGLLGDLVDIFFETADAKRRINILLIAAAIGSTESCKFLLQQGFPSDAHMIPEEISVILFGDICGRKMSPLLIAVHFKQTRNMEILVSSVQDSEIEGIQPQEQKLEIILLNEIRKRLETIYKGKSKGVVAGFRKGNSILVVYTDSFDVNVLEEEEQQFCGRSFILKNPKLIPHLKPISYVSGCDLSIEQKDEARHIINVNAKSLWSQHSNLNIITIHAVPQKDRPDGVPKCYIALYCTSKGIIPLGQNEFPKELKTNDNSHTLPVIVEEGFFELCPSYVTSSSSSFHQELKMGCSIGGMPANAGSRTFTGTIGPFIDINGQHGFLTCAHVLFDIQTATRIRHDNQTLPYVDVMQPESGILSQNVGPFGFATKPCGRVFKAVFDPQLDVSVDAAAVLITDDKRKPPKGRFAVISEENYKSTGFNDLPVFNSGRHVDPVNMKTRRIAVKCGKTTHLTQGMVNCWGTQVRNLAFNGSINNQQHEMKNQIEVLSVLPDVFFRPGDSGSGVFLVKKDNSLECIGMAIGSTSYHSTIVTPISAILNELGPGISLKTFP